MSRTAKVVTWDGKDVPMELRDLPAGRYVVESVDDEGTSARRVRLSLIRIFFT